MATRPVEFEGVTYEVPDDATDDEVLAFVAQQVGVGQRPVNPMLLGDPSAEDLRPDWVRRDDAYLGTDMPSTVAHSPAGFGQAASALVPGVGAAGAMGKQLEFGNQMSPFPTGIKDVPNIAENIGEGKFGAAALQAIGVVPDLGTAALIAKRGTPVAKELAAVARDPRAAFASRKPMAVAPLDENERAIQAALGDDPNRLVTQSPAAAKAEQQMYDQMIASGYTPERARARLKWLGQQGTMADIDPFEGLAKTASTTLKGQREARRTLESRARGAENRMLNMLDVTLAPENYYESMDLLKATRTNEGKPARAAAMAAAEGKTIKSDMIQRLQQESPYFNDAMASGRKIAREEAAREGIEIPMTETWYHGDTFNDPNLKIKHEPTLRMLDAAKQGYQELLKPYRNQFTGVIDNPTPVSVELSKTVEALTDEMRTRFPEYGKYLDTWAEPSQQLDALARGRKILANDPEVTLKMLRNTPAAGKEFTQIGLRRALEDKIRENPQAAVRLFNKGITRDKIRAVFPGKAEFRALHKQALREAAFQKTANANRARSQTAELKQGIKEIEGETSLPKEAVGAGVDALMGNKLGVMRRGLKWAAEKLQNKPPEPVLNEIAPVAFSRDPIIQERMIQRLKWRSMPTMRRGMEEPLPFDEESFPGIP